jgi:hypothetical protein
MRRFLLLLANEFKLARTAIPIHVIAMIEPVIMYALLTVILVHPTFDVHVTYPTNKTGHALVAAMQEIGSPIGLPYIRPVLVDSDEPRDMRQVITVEEQDGRAIAVQRYNLIDSNLVKNYRNRLTVSALRLWDKELGSRAVTVVERPTLPRDIPYNVYFGMAMLPLTAFLAAAMIGGVLTAQEFELHTMLEYRLATTPLGLVLVARLTRLVLSGLIASGLLLLAVGWLNDYWSTGIGWIGLALLPLTIIAGCLGIIAGLLLRRTLPAFLVGLVTSFVTWILGSAFKPAVGFGGWYEFASRFTPNTYTVELLFPYFYGIEIGSTLVSALTLSLAAIGMIALTAFVYRQQFVAQ